MKNILVVDDDQEIGLMLKMILEHKGYTVSISETAENLDNIIINNSIQLILLDMLIAGIKGTDVCATLKLNSKFSSIPICMITALPDSEQICRDAGANDFLPKPFDMDTLLNKINNLLK